MFKPPVARHAALLLYIVWVVFGMQLNTSPIGATIHYLGIGVIVTWLWYLAAPSKKEL